MPTNKPNKKIVRRLELAIVNDLLAAREVAGFAIPIDNAEIRRRIKLEYPTFLDLDRYDETRRSVIRQIVTIAAEDEKERVHELACKAYKAAFHNCGLEAPAPDAKNTEMPPPPERVAVLNQRITLGNLKIVTAQLYVNELGILSHIGSGREVTLPNQVGKAVAVLPFEDFRELLRRAWSRPNQVDTVAAKAISEVVQGVVKNYRGLLQKQQEEINNLKSFNKAVMADCQRLLSSKKRYWDALIAVAHLVGPSAFVNPITQHEDNASVESILTGVTLLCEAHRRLDFEMRQLGRQGVACGQRNNHVDNPG